MKKRQPRPHKQTTGTTRITLTDLVLAALGGALLFASLPKLEIALLAWVSFVPLLFAIRDKGPATGSLLGLTFGMVAYIGILYWTVFPISVYGGISVGLALIFMILLAFYNALFIAAFAAGVCWVRERWGISAFVSTPVALTTVEYLREFLFTGFPWGMVGHSQLPYLTLMQALDVTGVYGVTFVIGAVNAALFTILLRIIGAKKTFPIVETAVSALLVSSLVAYGIYALGRESRLMNENPAISVALIQPTIRQDLKWDPTYQDETMTIYEEMTLSTKDLRPALVVWPETATPFFFQNNPIYRPRVEALAKTMDAYLFFGTPAFEDEGGTIRYYNRAYLLDQGGEIIGHYDKIHLVPFGEYIPLRTVLFFVEKLAYGVIGDFSSGTATEPIPTQIGPIGSLICYEAIFPESARLFARKGAALLVNVTNDAWFGTTAAPYQHFAMTRLRAIETRLYLIRVANTGITSVVDPTGRPELTTGLFERKVAMGEVRPHPRMTFYTRFGDIFAQLVTAAFLLPFLFHFYGILKRKLS
jgi:apolipoprotein N-acyltransferase